MTKGLEEIKEVVSKFGYYFVNNISSENKSHRKTIIKDEYGYKYIIVLKDFIKTNGNCNFISKGNPFSLENLSLWLKLNKPETLLSEDNIYEGSDIRLKFYHTKCNEYFFMTWDNILQGQDCPVCKGIQVGEKTSLLHLYPNLALEWHSKNLFTAKDVTSGSHKKVLWKCLDCKNEWLATITDRTAKSSGCPNCASSKGEKKILIWLDANQLEFIPQAKFDDCKNKKVLPFDFYLPDYNLCIEYQGEQHYEAKEFFGGEESLKVRKKHDRIKKKYCKNKSINLLIIPYWEFDNIEQILSNTILELEGSN